MKKISTLVAEHYVWGDRCDGWHLVKQPSMGVIHERMPPGTSEVMHFHHRARQFFYMLSGTAVMDLDGESINGHVGVSAPNHRWGGIPFGAEGCSAHFPQQLVNGWRSGRPEGATD